MKDKIIREDINRNYLEDLPGSAEREDGQSHHEVGDGQRHDEEVGDGAQLRGYVDGGDDETVADDHHQVYESDDGEDRDGAGVVPDDGFHQGLAGRGVQLASRHVTSYTPPLSPTTGVRVVFRPLEIRPGENSGGKVSAFGEGLYPLAQEINNGVGILLKFQFVCVCGSSIN